MQLRNIGSFAGEDPYRSFRRDLIKQSREESTRVAKKNNNSSQSTESRGGTAYQNEHDLTRSPYDYIQINARNRDSKSFKSQVSFNPNKITQIEGRSLDEFMGEIKNSKSGQIHDSLDGSYMMIEVIDTDLVSAEESLPITRSQTILGGADISIDQVADSSKYREKYLKKGKNMNRPSTIVANARAELDSIQRSEIPRNRMSINDTVPTTQKVLPIKANLSKRH